MLYIIINYIGWLFVISGTFFVFTGSLGMLRMKDFYTRIHAAGVTDSLGAPLLLIGIAILHGSFLFFGKIMILVIFLLITGSTATHAIAMSALDKGLKPAKHTKKRERGLK